MNIPAKHHRGPGIQKMLWRTWGKVQWMAIGLLAPEIILYIALDQFLEARFITRELEAIEDDRKKNPDRKSVHLIFPLNTQSYKLLMHV